MGDSKLWERMEVVRKARIEIQLRWHAVFLQQHLETNGIVTHTVLLRRHEIARWKPLKRFSEQLEVAGRLEIEALSWPYCVYQLGRDDRDFVVAVLGPCGVFVLVCTVILRVCGYSEHQDATGDDGAVFLLLRVMICNHAGHPSS